MTERASTYFMRADKAFSRYRVLFSRCEGGRWTAPVAPSFTLPPPVNDADPFITPDGRRLYFVSSRPAPPRAGGSADLDIWRSERRADGRWAKATSGARRHGPMAPGRSRTSARR
jgi:hypothetical protein